MEANKPWNWINRFILQETRLLIETKLHDKFQSTFKKNIKQDTKEIIKQCKKDQMYKWFLSLQQQCT